MAYPGDPSLDETVQQRVLTAFAEAVRLHREGHSEESRTILRSISEVDPRFAPAQRLEQAIAAGAPVDLAQLIGEVTAQGAMDVQGNLDKARAAFAQRDFQAAMTLAQAILRDLPGHAEARQLALDAQARVRATGEIHTHIARIREALDAGLAEEAKGFLKLAKDLDPTNPDVAVLERRLSLAAKPLATEAEPEFEFEVFEPAAEAPAAAPRQAAAQAATATAPPPAPRVPQAPPAAPPPPRPAPAPAARAAPPPPAPPGAAGMRFDQPGAAFTMEFHPGFGEGADSGGGARESKASEARIRSLLDQGQQEFDRVDFQSAIDTWSRIFLIDSQHAEAERRIALARSRREEVERLAEQRFHQASDAYRDKRLDEARALCKEVLALLPQHLEAHDLLQRLETPAAPPPPPAPPPLAAEDDLFRDDFVPHAVGAGAPGPPPGGPAATLPQRAGERAARPSRVRLTLPAIPLPLLGVGVGVLVLVLVAGFLLRHKVFRGDSRAVAQALAQSEALAGTGNLQGAIQVLQSLQGQVEGEEANQVNQRILEYQRKLKAKPTPPPVTAGKEAAEALAAGRRVRAMQLVSAGLAKAPDDGELLKLQAQIIAYSPVFPRLADEIKRRDWEGARAAASQVLAERPGDPEVRMIWERATFNLAVAQLRKYQVAQAHGLLVELARASDDPEVKRLEEFARSYLSRPADPLYQTFVNNSELRPLD